MTSQFPSDRQNMQSPEDTAYVPVVEPQPQVEPILPPSPIPARRLSAWYFWVPLLLQSVLIMTVPAQDAYTYVTGKSVTLATAPVDPYDFLRGYSQTLSYEISIPENLKKVQGGKEFFAAHDRSTKASLYVVLQAPDAATGKIPTPWKPIRVSEKRPLHLIQNQVALKGEYISGRVLYGLETYYMPEDQRNRINAEISQIQRPNPTQNQTQNRHTFVVDTKVDAQGNSVPLSLWVGDRNYRF